MEDKTTAGLPKTGIRIEDGFIAKYDKKGARVARNRIDGVTNPTCKMEFDPRSVIAAVVSAGVIAGGKYGIRHDLVASIVTVIGIGVGILAVIGVVRKVLVYSYRERIVKYEVEDSFGELRAFVGELQDLVEDERAREPRVEASDRRADGKNS